MTAEPQDAARIRISVVVPVLDHADTIGEALESVLGQTVPPEEVLVIDDGSTDGSAARAEAFGSSVRVIRQGQQGVGVARNRGIREAGGTAIAFIDADDRWLPRKLELQVAMLSSGIDIVSGWVARVPDGQWDAAVSGRPARDTWMAGPLPSSVLIRRSTFETVGVFGTHRAGEFIDWYARALAVGVRTAQVDELVVLRRLHALNHGVRQRDAYASSYLDIARAAIARRSDRSRL